MELIGRDDLEFLTNKFRSKSLEDMWQFVKEKQYWLSSTDGKNDE